MKTTNAKQINYVNAVYLIGAPIAFIVLAPIALHLYGFQLSILLFTIFYGGLTGLAITGGYHRLYSHRSYEANAIVRFFYLLIGAAALQNSALKWCTDHRRHHRFVDTEQDPYNIKKGFFWAHIGWVFYKDEPIPFNELPSDLTKDKLVVLQNKYYLPLALLMCFGVPTLFGWLYADNAFGGFVFGGLFRVLFTTHTTALINSGCHMFGKQPYSITNSARDSWLMAFLSNGEGFHNYHHKFQFDYRNGVRWYQWDPTKWAVRFMSWVGLTKNLKRATKDAILKAKQDIQHKLQSQNQVWQ